MDQDCCPEGQKFCSKANKCLENEATDEECGKITFKYISDYNND